MQEGLYTKECVSEILDPTVEGGYEEGRMEALARVATMNQVVEILQKSSRETHNR